MGWGAFARDVVAVVTGRKKIFYGWWILAASFASLGLVNGAAFWSASLFIEPMEQEFGWSRAQVSLGFSLSLGLSGLAAPFVGRWVDRRGPRSGILIGATATAATYLLLATTQTLWQWYLFLALNGILRHFVFIIPFMALVSRWFDTKRTIAASILASGLMVGGMSVVPVVRLLIDSLEWRGTFVVIGVAMAAIIGGSALLVVRDWPAQMNTVPDGRVTYRAQGGEKAVPEPALGLRLGEAMRTPLFWALAAGMMFFPFAMVTWITHAAPFYESVGISPGVAALLVSLSAGLAIPPRLLAGYVADRLPSLELGAATVGFVLTAAMAVLLFDTSPIGIAVFFPLFVLGFASGGALFEALLIPRAFGVQHYATILGMVVVLQTIGQLAGPTIAGAIYDRTGSYDGAVAMMMMLFFATGASFVVASRLKRPELPKRIENVEPGEVPVVRV